MPTPEELAAQQAQEEAAKAAAEPKKVEVQLDPRFKSVEDQAKAYPEAEKKMQQEAQKRSELERQNQELQARLAVPNPPVQDTTNYDELFWQKPTEVISRVVERYIAPLEEDRYETKKQKFADDPDFKKYESQIDTVMKAQPHLRKDPESFGKMFKIMKAMDFNQDEYEKQVRAKVMAEIQDKTGGSVEGGTPSALPKETKTDLSDDEKNVARKFHPDLSPQKAYEKYAESKNKYS